MLLLMRNAGYRQALQVPQSMQKVRSGLHRREQTDRHTANCQRRCRCSREHSRHLSSPSCLRKRAGARRLERCVLCEWDVYTAQGRLAVVPNCLRLLRDNTMPLRDKGADARS
ncbi:hypothetical protein BST61_g10133 [Cercospora zeina]